MFAFPSFGTRARIRPDAPAIPAGQRVWAIGDVHGRRDLLDLLLDRIEAHERPLAAADVSLVFLGDLVDRGPDSKGVMERVAQLRAGARPVRVLRGNHDDVFQRAVAGDVRALRYLIQIGGRSTVTSYGIGDEDYDALDFPELTQRLVELVPAAHVALLEAMETSVEIGDYLFVHAGIRPNVPIAEQTAEDLCWIRGEFLDHRRPFEKFIVHGHSITAEPDIRSNRIGIDTGAYDSNRLTAIVLEGTRRAVIST